MAVVPVQGQQITIGGSVYGGGNEGKVFGNSTVTVRAGDIDKVFGGARMADVGGRAFVHVDGAKASGNMIINQVYGGNDISGTIGRSDELPAELEDIETIEGTGIRTESGKCDIDNTWNAFVRTSCPIQESGKDKYRIIIGSLFGGGNGDYDYEHYPGKAKPELGKAYLELKGGCIAHAYGGGNNATVTQNTTICIDNQGSVLEKVLTADDMTPANFVALANRLGLSTVQSDVDIKGYHFARVFGGNNKAPMPIMPRWNLKNGCIRDLYSGGNAGAMTNPTGIFLTIREDGMKVHNVYGGCRMADVNPDKHDIDEMTIEGSWIPAGYAARVVIYGGDIDNVYGGNDVTGNVYGGNAIGIHSSINGDVYGGGNGSYAYTDQSSLKDSEAYKDFYYVPGSSSVDALNAFRPNAEAVSIRVQGTKNKNTIIGGAIYCGGNSATLRNDDPKKNATAQLKIGSYVIADKVFLGNNGANMVTEAMLQKYSDTSFSSINLKNEGVMAKYMDGVTMMIEPEVVFDEDGYEPYSTMFGSFYCGGNVGSMKINRALNISFNDKVVIYNKVVGGSNEANVYESNYNAQYLGGLLGATDANGNKLILNFGGLKIQPKRWVDINDKSQGLMWNTVNSTSYDPTSKTYEPMDPVTTGTASVDNPESNTSDDLIRRFQGGNIYGGCYSNGHVEGNVVINIDSTLVDRKGPNAIFDQIEEVEGEAKLYGPDSYKIIERKTGVLLNKQGMDPLGRGLNVFGGGYGGDSEIWGSTTININSGYVFQVFGGGEQGAIGKANGYNNETQEIEYDYDTKYSTCINLKGQHPGTYRGDTDNRDNVVDHKDMAEAEFIYGGSFEGLIAGNTVINLGNGRIFNSFAGSCNADILGHTETHVGRNTSNDNDPGFPWIRDHIYGGNDLGGSILNVGESDFKSRVNTDVLSQVYGYEESAGENAPGNTNPKVLKASAYTEFVQGRVEYIFGGCYGDYDYTNPHYDAYTDSNGQPLVDSQTGKPVFSKPWMDNAFVNFKPNNNIRNRVARIYGAGQGHAFYHASDADRDKMQDRSYVLINAPDVSNYINTEVFGAGDYSGVGMRYNENATTIGETTIPALTPTIAQSNADGVTASTVIDLMSGTLKDIYGASYNEGITRRTIVNVPSGSTIQVQRIFGGGYGTSNDKPCDVYESNVNFASNQAVTTGSPNDIDNDGYQTAGGIYGGNNSFRRTLYAHVNIKSKVVQDKVKGYTTRVFGAGYGKHTWAQYTEVNLEDGADVYEAYGGGYGGMVLNKETVAAWNVLIDLGNGYTDNEDIEHGGLKNPLAKAVNNPLVTEFHGKKFNTNVHIKQGAFVGNYCYAGGLGADATVSGTTYIELLGGQVKKDIYGGGTSGGVKDTLKLGNNVFVAGTNVYIEGGTVRNVYGGGWAGNVGYTKMENVTDNTDPENPKTTKQVTENIPGETNVVIGIRKDQVKIDEDNIALNYTRGIPAIQRNAYGGGEGGAVFGATHLTINNGYIGYIYNSTLEDDPETIVDERYEEKLHDETWEDHVGLNRLSDCGNAFGGGYDDNSSVDETNITIWGGIIRNSIYGGGEIATVGRGKTTESGEANSERTLEAIYKAGSTRIEMFNGHVKKDVFGGGKGFNILGYGGVHGFYTDGYVFGQTEVHIHGGEIGTVDGIANGDGNVFGGGDLGYVYSSGYFSTKTQSDWNVSTGSPGHHYFYNDAGLWTEDCKVVIAPFLQVKNAGTIAGKTYSKYQYVETDELNKLPKEKSNWTSLFTGDKNADGSTNADDPVERGVIIHNAVFGGGNVASNSDSHYADAPTVYGNTTATLYDVFNRDFITVGTEHIGGIYGGGNRSLVEGYRELNITNYGTDYYGQNDQISLEDYRKLSNRERAYFQLQYVCMQDFSDGNKEYHANVDKISEEEYKNLPSQYRNTNYWEMYGFCSIYAGRLLNTIQRADFCGVFGSRMVLQGARDRVASVGSTADYTINRIGELSLNKQRPVGASANSDEGVHGNYFGIYNVVNYLGNLTSDVLFDDKRKYVSGNNTIEDSKTYYQWKDEHKKNRDRNNGTSFNQVALASGVFLELTTEKSTPSKKDYGYITGIIELDLINVKKDIEGGGYVYARNQHGTRTEVSHENTLLSSYNKMTDNEARTYKYYEYDPDELHEIQTSGNFIHKTKRIVDDCYPKNGVYDDGYIESPAHYWFIKGEVYIYDQVVSAYAGSASAYSKEVKIPLTITAGSNGRLKLLNVQPNLYAYFADDTRSEDNKITQDGVKIDNERTIMKLNDVITWWDWNQLSDNEQKYFVKNTYVNVDTCYVGGVLYPAGTYVLENDPSIHSAGQKTAYETFKENPPIIQNQKGDEVTVGYMFHSSNNISHDNGYVLTFNMDSPTDWDKWYSPTGGTSVENKIQNENYSNQNNYIEGPTYYLDGANGLYGQRWYDLDDIITQDIYDDYTSTVSQMSQTPTGQATVVKAYVAKDDYPVNGKTVVEGNPIYESVYNGLSETDKTHFDRAMVCTSTIQLGPEEYILNGDLVGENQMASLAAKYREYNNKQQNTDPVTQEEAATYISRNLSEAYICTSEGKYGGQYFTGNTNYSALKAWCSLSNDRDKFKFNYDALDLLVDSLYPGENHTEVYDYDNNHLLYSEVKPVEYTAVYKGTSGKYKDNNGVEHTISSGESLSREAFENVLNEKCHYTRILLEEAGSNTVYIAKQNFIHSGTPYAKGQDISKKDYDVLGNDQSKVTVTTIQSPAAKTTVYYCYDGYDTEEGKKTGDVINTATFTNLENYQEDFNIQGKEPTETTTLYVSRESNARDVTSEKVITVVYQYTYYESDDEGEGVSLTNELHVVNIHLQLESGAPVIGPLNTPAIILPGDHLKLKPPSVDPGLYEILTNGWEMYTNEEDALRHRNGTQFYNNRTPFYWYQNEKTWVNYFSKTYLGKVYSPTPVIVTVANYHDIDEVMQDKKYHLHVDHPDVMRDSKIYIDNRDCKSDNTKSELDLLKDFFDLSLITKTTPGITTEGDSITNTNNKLKGHKLLNSRVHGGRNLEFFLNSDVSPKAYTNWEPIGNSHIPDDPSTPDVDESVVGECFDGVLHGDGYTISGLSNSLFGHLCGDVYNLGVTGTFTSAGIANEGDGYIENCWMKSTATSGFNSTTKAIFNAPDNDSKTHVVNSYYPEAPLIKQKQDPDNEDSPMVTVQVSPYYATSGPAIRMDSTAFYNGTVAYNLNGFYLNKRYYDGIGQSGDNEYHYFKQDETGELTNTTSNYPSSSDPTKGSLNYVENRYLDGDFRYANGKIPESADKRQRIVTVEKTENDITTTITTTVYDPVWPDDYLFFGQMLTYGYDESYAHEDTPSHIVKQSGSLPLSQMSNRVYRAPAYFRSKTMGVAHFNPWCYLAAYSAPKSVSDTNLKKAYPGMTAIDFNGHNDHTYKLGLNNGLFYQPLLDDDGLLNISNNGETPNLLVYAPAETAPNAGDYANKKTYDVLTSGYFNEPEFNDYHESPLHYDDGHTEYHRIHQATTEDITGHLVLYNKISNSDHLLVDRQDFNCPIEYTMGSGYRMWYQRMPDNFVDRNKGWEGISLPFSAEMVTTQEKGELTHFYEGSTAGHEYWLREFNGTITQKTDANNQPVTGVYLASFDPIAKGTHEKTYTNTFLWDYYYSKDEYLDKNTDEYQKKYYSAAYLSDLYDDVNDYPYSEARKAYLVGFPGATYYEFDLSGSWTPANRYQNVTIPSPGRQTVTFVSGEEAVIPISDGDNETISNYQFMPTYLNNPEISSGMTVYQLDNQGESFVKTATDAIDIVAFRPYFICPTSMAHSRQTRGIEQIMFSQSDNKFGVEEHGDPTQEEVAGSLSIYTKKQKIVVESALNYVTDVRIVNLAGQTINTFSIEPGETIETRLYNAGVYIVHAADGKYIKKLSVK